MAKLFLELFLTYSLFVCWTLAEEAPAKPVLSCKAAVSKLMRTQMAEIGTCTKSMQFKNAKEKSAKMNCILKCVAVRVKLLTPEATLDRATLDKFIEVEVPETLVGKATTVINKCYDIAYGKLDPEEEFCHSYQALIKCALDAISKFCD